MNWLSSNLTNHLKHNNPKKGEISLIIRFLKIYKKKTGRLSYSQVLNLAMDWALLRKKEALSIKNSGKIKVIKTLPYFDIVELVSTESKLWDGNLMRNCINSYSTQNKIYSLRTKKMIPKCHMEVSGSQIIQIKGIGNSRLNSKYTSIILDFILSNNYKIENSTLIFLNLVPITVAEYNFFSQFKKFKAYKIGNLFYFNPELINYKIDTKVTVNLNNLFNMASTYQLKKLFTFCLDHCKINHLKLEELCLINNLEMVSLILKKGIKVTDRAIINAKLNNNLKMVTLLLYAGGNLHVLNYLYKSSIR